MSMSDFFAGIASDDRTPDVTRLLMAVSSVETQLLMLRRAITEVAPLIAAAERRAIEAEKRAKRVEKKLARLTGADERLLKAATAYLLRIRDLTTQEYALGGDREEYHALREVLEDLGVVEPNELPMEEE